MEILNVRIRINYEKVGYGLLLLFSLNLPFVEEMFPLLEIVNKILRVVSAAVILLLYVTKRRKVNSFLLLLGLFSLVYVFSTVFHNEDIRRAFLQTVGVFTYALLIDNMINKDVKICLDVITIVFELLIYVNLLTILIFPEGMYETRSFFDRQTENWILGLDNSQAPYYFIAIMVSILRTYYTTGKTKLNLRNIALIAACIITVAIRWQATAVVGLFIVLACLVFAGALRKIRAFNIWTCYLAVIILFFALVVANVSSNFSYIIQSVLRKDITLSARVSVWNRSLLFILQKPIFGYGNVTLRHSYEMIGHAHAHNIFLQVMLTGGVLQLLPFFGILFAAAKRIMMNRGHIISYVSMIILFALLIMLQVEAYINWNWFVIIQLAYDSDYIIRQQKRSKPEITMA